VVSYVSSAGASRSGTPCDKAAASVWARVRAEEESEKDEEKMADRRRGGGVGCNRRLFGAQKKVIECTKEDGWTISEH
jgi:hypothetical protein